MTEEEFDEKFARLRNAYDEIMKRMDAINYSEIDIDDDFDEFMDLMDDASDSIDKMCALVDKAFDELDDEDSSDTEENE